MIDSTLSGDIQIGTRLLHNVQASDPNGDVLTYSLSGSVPAGMTIDADGLLDWTPTADQLGSHSFTVTVDDGQGETTDKNITLNVVSTPSNVAPEFVNDPKTAGVANALYYFDADAVDADADMLIYSLVTAPTGMIIDSQTGVIQWIPGESGTEDVTVRVVDTRGGMDLLSYSIDVDSTNLPAVIHSDPSTTAYINETYTYDVVATDVAGHRLTYSIDQTVSTADDNGTFAIDADTGQITWTPVTAGTDVIQVNVVDEFGAGVSQVFTVSVLAAPENQAPYLTPDVPPLSVERGETYTFDFDATDPEGGTLTWSLPTGPVGATIDPGTGVLTWDVPLSAVPGTLESFHVDVSDGTLSGSLNYQVVVQYENFTPTVDAIPDETITAGQTFRRDVVARDSNEGDVLTYSLDPAATALGMEIDTYGRITWETGVSDAIPAGQTISVTVSDGRASVTEDFVLTVLADTTAPTVSIIAGDETPDVGDELSLRLHAIDDVSVTDRTLVLESVTRDGTTTPLNQALTLDVNGQARLTLTEDLIGELVFSGSAVDEAGNTGTADVVNLTVVNPADGSPPVVVLDVEDGATFVEPTTFIGSISDDLPNDLTWTVTATPLEGGPSRVLGSGSGAVDHSALAQFDTTVLANGSYVIAATANDGGGNTSIDSRIVSVDGQYKPGRFTVSFVDLEVPVSGIPITITRTYDSLEAENQEDLGYGWTLDIANTKVRVEQPDGTAPGLFGYAPMTDGTRVIITLPDGDEQGFTFAPQKQVQGWVQTPDYLPHFVPDYGVNSELVVDNRYIRKLGETYIDMETGRDYTPADPALGGSYELILRNGSSLAINAQTGDLASITDRTDNSIRFTGDGIYHNSGRGIDFERDWEGRITSITDPAGNQLHYEYDVATGDLIAATDRSGITTRFTYHADFPHRLDAIVDPLDRVFSRTEYDEAGRVIRLIDGGENAVAISYDIQNKTQTTTDPLGNVEQIVFDSEGNVTQEVDALGGVVTRTFDQNGSVLTETDQRGNTTTLKYDADGNAISATDPLGNESLALYDNYGAVIATTDALGNTTRNSYNSRGELISITDASGGVARFEFDERGNPIAIVDPLGQRSELSYNSYGDLISWTNPLGHTSTYEFDANGRRTAVTSTMTAYDGSSRQLVASTAYDGEGRVLQQTNPDGNTISHEYDLAGRRTALVDPLGRRTDYVRNQLGQTVQIVDPNGHSFFTEFDANGNVIAHTDPRGNVTSYVLNPVGDVIHTILPDATPQNPDDNPFTSVEYDAAGNPTALVDAMGNRTETEYDAAGRPVLIHDALSNTTTRKYDAVGRVVAETDPRGNSIQIHYNELGQSTRHDFSDGSFSLTEYDAVGKTIKETTRGGNIVQYEYDAGGRLTSISDSLGPIEFTEYDELGNAVRITSATGDVTTFQPNAMGKPTVIISPTGEQSTILYDAAGHPETVITPDGETIHESYDALGRVQSRQFDDGTTETFVRDERGRLVSKTDRYGRTTARTYGPRGQVLSKTNADGETTQFTYDHNANLLSVTNPLNETTQYSYDALNRLELLTSADQTITSYTYDANGNRTTVTDPLLNTTTFTYDSMNRVTTSTNETGATRSFEYDIAGNLTRSVDPNGDVREFAYDTRGRVTTETWLDGGAEIYVAQFGYDLENQLVSAADDFSAYAIGYDGDGRMTSLDNLGTPDVPHVVLSQSLDTAGRRLSVNATVDGIADLQNSYQYDTRGNMSQIIQQSSPGGNDVITKRVDFDHNNFGQMIGIHRYSDEAGSTLVTSSEYSFDAIGRLESLSHENSDGIFSEYDYEYDELGRIDRLTSPDGVAEYQYDQIGQITGVDNSSLADEAFSYDAAGNRTGGGYVNGPANQMLSDGTYTYTYDSNGQRATRTETANGYVMEYDWDYRGRLTGTTLRNDAGASILSVEFVYDVFNKRIGKIVDPDGDGPLPATRESFVYDGENVLLTFDDQGNVSHRYLHGPQIDQPLADEQRNSDGSLSNVLWLHADHQGSVRDLADHQGTHVNHVIYDAFGTPISQTNPVAEVTYKFTGREYDAETGLYFYRARYYDSTNGVFISEDPIGFAAGDYNISRYVTNNPLNFNDPTGQILSMTMSTTGGLSGSALQAYALFSVFVLAAAHPFSRLAISNAIHNAYLKILTATAGGATGGYVTGNIAKKLADDFEAIGKKIGDAITESTEAAAAAALALAKGLLRGLCTDEQWSANPCECLPPGVEAAIWDDVEHDDVDQDDPIVSLRFFKTGTLQPGAVFPDEGDEDAAFPVPGAAQQNAREFVNRQGFGAGGGDDAGHLRARQLGGAGSLYQKWPNFIPQDRKVNRGQFRVHEKKIYDSTQGPQGSAKCCLVTPVYIGAESITKKPNRPIAVGYFTFNSTGKGLNLHSVKAFANLPNADKSGYPVTANMLSNLPQNLQDITKLFLP